MEFQEISKLLEVNRATLFHWMSGRRSPSKETMLRIEEKLGWPVDEQMKAYDTLITGETAPNGKPKDDYGAQLRHFLETRYDCIQQVRFGK
jgi:transcriptional regulator with XRE-family HTH domain